MDMCEWYLFLAFLFLLVANFDPLSHLFCRSAAAVPRLRVWISTVAHISMTFQIMDHVAMCDAPTARSRTLRRERFGVPHLPWIKWGGAAQQKRRGNWTRIVKKMEFICLSMGSSL